HRMRGGRDGARPVSRLLVVHQFFFFQAEDGIRDGHVTGVQTLLFRSFFQPRRADGGGLWDRKPGLEERGDPVRSYQRSDAETAQTQTQPHTATQCKASSSVSQDGGIVDTSLMWTATFAPMSRGLPVRGFTLVEVLVVIVLL